MTREQDWRIHEYMGNDLTGWEWEHDPLSSECALRDIDLEIIPHYSTTWEGAGLVMEWLKSKSIVHKLVFYEDDDYYMARISRWGYSDVYKDDHSAPQALAKAFIAAMEERKI